MHLGHRCVAKETVPGPGPFSPHRESPVDRPQLLSPLCLDLNSILGVRRTPEKERGIKDRRALGEESERERFSRASIIALKLPLPLKETLTLFYSKGDREGNNAKKGNRGKGSSGNKGGVVSDT
ncbi:hypothetical protein NPIL_583381 [Nephila pilipes]|uniref:Uncharacterized protein n=1 Tax=Nephila pilipes TaxID=299642 RepID=A0A8X6UEX2_NEPPI|nr:hypothetical protein NPIL_583381 [Nephila pilipes]